MCPEGTARSTTSVLVVDDDPVSVRLLEQVLTVGGFGRVLTSSNPHEVLELCERELPDVLLLDLTMPGLDGFTVLEQLAPRLAAVPPLRVLVLSGHEHPAIERRARALGAVGAMGKTAARAELLERLDAILAG